MSLLSCGSAARRRIASPHHKTSARVQMTFGATFSHLLFTGYMCKGGGFGQVDQYTGQELFQVPNSCSLHNLNACFRRGPTRSSYLQMKVCHRPKPAIRTDP